jgi:hypothetical protein
MRRVAMCAGHIMSEAHAFSTSEPSEPLSWQEICRRYADQWVALVDIEWVWVWVWVWVDEDEVGTARVAGHGPRRADPLEQARHLHSRYEEIRHDMVGRAVKVTRFDPFTARRSWDAAPARSEVPCPRRTRKRNRNALISLAPPWRVAAALTRWWCWRSGSSLWNNEIAARQPAESRA